MVFQITSDDRVFIQKKPFNSDKSNHRTNQSVHNGAETTQSRSERGVTVVVNGHGLPIDI